MKPGTLFLFGSKISEKTGATRFCEVKNNIIQNDGYWEEWPVVEKNEIVMFIKELDLVPEKMSYKSLSSSPQQQEKSPYTFIFLAILVLSLFSSGVLIETIFTFGCTLAKCCWLISSIFTSSACINKLVEATSSPLINTTAARIMLSSVSPFDNSNNRSLAAKIWEKKKKIPGFVFMHKEKLIWVSKYDLKNFFVEAKNNHDS